MFDRLAIILVGASHTGKTSTLREYTEYYKEAVTVFKKGWRHGVSPYKPKFPTVKISAYILPSSPTESIPLHETIKGDNMIEDEVVLAKAEYAHQLAVASKMSYLMIKGSDAMNGVGIA